MGCTKKEGDKVNTAKTLNSRYFKKLQCPVCARRKESISDFTINWKYIRFNVETRMMEMQGFCNFCFKEYRLQFVVWKNMNGKITMDVWLKDNRTGRIILAGEAVVR